MAESVMSIEEQLLRITNAVPALLAFVGPDARYVWGNEAYGAWCGIHPAEIRGRHVSEVLGPAAWIAVRPYVERALGGEHVTFETRMEYQAAPARNVNAQYVPQRDATGAVIGFVLLVHDITPRIAAERALQHSERLLELSQQMAHVGSWEMALTPGTVAKAWSSETFRIFGFAPDSIEVTTDVFFDAVHPDDREHIRAITREALANGDSFEVEHRILRPDGAERILHEWVRIDRGADGLPLRMFGTCQDVTEQRHNERTIQRALEELRESSRRKDEFLAMLSHELRNPLAPIVSAIQLLELNRDAASAESRDLYGILSRQAGHMRRMLDDLLEVSRLSQGKITLQRKTLELGAILSQAVEVSEPLLRAKRHRLVSASHSGATLDGDPARLVQVFANLLNNAAKYTDDGGTITLSTEIESGHAVVSVRDTGIGMTEEMTARAFELFAQETRSLDRAQGGLGIGLTMVRSLVEMHGGSVRARSDGPGHGSEIVVRLPLSRP